MVSNILSSAVAVVMFDAQGLGQHRGRCVPARTRGQSGSVRGGPDEGGVGRGALRVDAGHGRSGSRHIRIPRWAARDRASSSGTASNSTPPDFGLFAHLLRGLDDAGGPMSYRYRPCMRRRATLERAAIRVCIACGVSTAFVGEGSPVEVEGADALCPGEGVQPVSTVGAPRRGPASPAARSAIAASGPGDSPSYDSGVVAGVIDVVAPCVECRWFGTILHVNLARTRRRRYATHPRCAGLCVSLPQADPPGRCRLP